MNCWEGDSNILRFLVGLLQYLYVKVYFKKYRLLVKLVIDIRIKQFRIGEGKCISNRDNFRLVSN